MVTKPHQKPTPNLHNLPVLPPIKTPLHKTNTHHSHQLSYPSHIHTVHSSLLPASQQTTPTHANDPRTIHRIEPTRLWWNATYSPQSRFYAKRRDKFFTPKSASTKAGVYGYLRVKVRVQAHVQFLGKVLRMLLEISR